MSCLRRGSAEVTRGAYGLLTFQTVADLLEHVLLMRKGLLELLHLLLLLVHFDGVIFDCVESLSSVVFILAVDELEPLMQVTLRME